MTIIKHDFQGKNPATALQKTEKKKIPGFQLRIELSYSSPSIWRTVNVPGTLTLAAFHSVIQTCFGWNDEATHRFMVGKIFYSPGGSSVAHGIRSDNDIELHQLEKEMGFIFSYLYDGGCGWECEISLERLFHDTKDIPHPVLQAAARAHPPTIIEDIHEYQDLIIRLEQPDANRKKILAEHDLDSDFDPSHCDIPAINEQLRKLK